MKTEGLLNNFYDARALTESVRETESRVIAKNKKVYWSTFDTDFDEYCQRFYDVNPGFLRRDLMVKGNDTPIFGLELAGYGYMFEADSSLFTAGVHVSLTNPLAEIEGSMANECPANRFFVNGDLLDGNTWRKLNIMRKIVTGNCGFDVIIFSPEGGSLVLGGGGEPMDAITSLLIRKCWPLLSTNEGTLLASYTSKVSELGDWITQLKSKYQIDGGYIKKGDRNKLMLKRNVNGPESIPNPKDLVVTGNGG
jgi:hypothetical protein